MARNCPFGTTKLFILERTLSRKTITGIFLTLEYCKINDLTFACKLARLEGAEFNTVRTLRLFFNCSFVF